MITNLPLTTVFEWSDRFETLGGSYVLFSYQHLEQTSKFFMTDFNGVSYTGTALVRTMIMVRHYTNVYPDATWYFCGRMNVLDLVWHDLYTSDEGDTDNYSGPEDEVVSPASFESTQAELLDLLKTNQAAYSDLNLCIKILSMLRSLLER